MAYYWEVERVRDDELPEAERLSQFVILFWPFHQSVAHPDSPGPTSPPGRLKARPLSEAAGRLFSSSAIEESTPPPSSFLVLHDAPP